MKYDMTFFPSNDIRVDMGQINQAMLAHSQQTLDK